MKISILLTPIDGVIFIGTSNGFRLRPWPVDNLWHNLHLIATLFSNFTKQFQSSQFLPKIYNIYYY